MEQGWIKLHRIIIKNWIWQDALKLKWWLDLLLMANHSSKKVLLGNNLMEIPRGSLHTSMVHLAERWNADKKTVKKFLDLLEKDSMISFTTSIKGTTISITNYNSLQGPRENEEMKSSTTPTPSRFEAVDNPVDNFMDNHPENPSKILKEGHMDKFWDNSGDNGIIPPVNRNIKPPRSSNIMGVMDNPPPPKNNTLVHAMDSTMDNTVDTYMDKAMGNSMDKNMDNSRDISTVSSRDVTVVNPMDTNNNLNNINNLNNAKELEEGKEREKELKTLSSSATPKATSPLSFSTPIHEKIYNTLGEIAYRTWFMDCQVESSPSSTVLKVDSDFKKSVIDSKFKLKLNLILGEIVEVKVA